LLWPNLLRHDSGYLGSALLPERVKGELQERVTPVTRAIRRLARMGLNMKVWWSWMVLGMKDVF